jgi:polysaccharide export outer membrane protein
MKKVTYFDNIGASELSIIADSIEPVIQTGDLLSISVSSLSPEVASVFNSSNTPTTSYSSNILAQTTGYMVSQEGYIKFPLLGSIKAVGLKKKDLEDLITTKLKEAKLLFDPIVNVRYLNFHVTVLGEVNHPGLINITNDRVTLLEAIGLAGDLTIYGKRDNVLLLRRQEGKKVVTRLDLNSKDVLTSPYFYLKSNDVLYIQPAKNKVASVSRSREILPIVLSGLSFLAIVVDRIGR